MVSRSCWVFPLPGQPPIALDRVAAGAAELTIGRDAACDVRLEGPTSRAGTPRCGGRARHAAGAARSRQPQRRPGQRAGRRAGVLERGDVVRVGGWVGVVTAHPGALAEIAPGLFGGAALAAAVDPLRRAAPSDLPIVLEGETGTGKEVVTRAIHGWSGRPGPFVAVNCAALPEALAEGELFGYRRGAFTGADKASAGFFRSAEGGTLLLDEVSDLPLTLQAKLLRVLEQREVQPLGETRPVAIDVRIVVAGQQSLMDAVARGAFPRRSAGAAGRADGEAAAAARPARGRRAAVLAASAQTAARGGCRPSRAIWSSGSACTTGLSTCASWSSWCGGCWCCARARRRCAPRICPSGSAAGRPRARRTSRRERAAAARRPPRRRRARRAAAGGAPRPSGAGGRAARRGRQRRARRRHAGHHPPARLPADGGQRGRSRGAPPAGRRSGAS